MYARRFLISTRLFFAAITTVAIAWQFVYGVLYQPTFNYVNFFSFFTILSNVFVTIVFVVSALRLARGYKKLRPADDILRGASVLYMIVTGIVYTLLLSGKDVGLTLPLVNLQLHFIMPLVVVFDWLYQPFAHKLQTRQTLWWMVFPAAYLVYSLLRGAAVGWYPYPFLNPALAGGYIGVALYCGGILLLLFIMSFVLLKLGDMVKLRRHVT